MTKGDLTLSNGPTTNDEPGDNKRGRWSLCTDNKTSVSRLRAVNGTESAAQPRLETVACQEKEETYRAQKEHCDVSREEKVAGGIHEIGNDDLVRSQ